MGDLKPSPPYVIRNDFFAGDALDATRFQEARPFPHVCIDAFLPPEQVGFLAAHFPDVDHPVWLDWRTRHPSQYGKLGPGDSSNFDLLDADFRSALAQFNAPGFLRYLEQLTGIDKLIGDPYFTGGGMHQIVRGGILDVHTDFNYYARLNLYRRLNVLIYLTEDWQPGDGGELELWDKAPAVGGACVRSIEPLMNRAVVFQTDKQSFHGHPNEWRAPPERTRRSLAFYYYTAQPADGAVYDELTDFQGVASKDLPG